MARNVALTGYARELSEREKPVRIGLIGSGEMGTDIVSRTAMMDGVDVAAIAEINRAAAHGAVKIAYGEVGYRRDAATTDALNRAIEDGRIAIVTDSFLMFENGLIDVVIDATGIPVLGAELGLAAMERGKHLVMMNVEADVTIGTFLRREADRLGVVYSLGAGDEPSFCMELIEFVTSMGHDIVCAGNGKNNPLNFDAVPEEYLAEAKAPNMNARMLVEFVDGSKTIVEMAAIADATGLIRDCPGMHGPNAGPQDLAKILIPESDGGFLSGKGRVNFSVGKGLAPGVFVVIHARHPRIHERMRDLKMGEGPYFSFVRPYHLTSLEVPLSCARTVMHGKADMVPLDRPVAEVCALAKRDLKVDKTLDQIGEYCYRAWVMEVGEACSFTALPCGLPAGGRITAPTRKGELITADNATQPQGSAIVAMRARQDTMIMGEV